MTTGTIEYHGTPATHGHHRMMIDLQKCDLSKVFTQQHEQRINVIDKTRYHAQVDQKRFRIVERMSARFGFEAAEVVSIIIQYHQALNKVESLYK